MVPREKFLALTEHHDRAVAAGCIAVKLCARRDRY
jgi:hypothetical protein